MVGATEKETGKEKGWKGLLGGLMQGRAGAQEGCQCSMFKFEEGSALFGNSQLTTEEELLSIRQASSVNSKKTKQAIDSGAPCMWAEQPGPEVEGRKEEQRWNQGLYLEGTGMLSLKKKRHKGNPGARWFACRDSLPSMCAAGVPSAGARFGDYSDKQKQIKSTLPLPR